MIWHLTRRKNMNISFHRTGAEYCEIDQVVSYVVKKQLATNSILVTMIKSAAEEFSFEGFHMHKFLVGLRYGLFLDYTTVPRSGESSVGERTDLGGTRRKECYRE